MTNKFKLLLIFILYLSVLFIFYNSLKINFTEKFNENSIKTIDYKDDILLKSDTINVNYIGIQNLKLNNLELGDTQLDEDTLKSLKTIPKIENEICLDNYCIDYKKANTLKHFFPYGTIMSYYGKPESIPPGWALCDGKHGTPNLTAKFIIGAGSKYKKHNTGGQKNFQITTDNIPIFENFIDTSPKFYGNDIFYIMRIIKDIDPIQLSNKCKEQDNTQNKKLDRLKTQLTCLNHKPWVN
jgi:hypothetical protein